MMDRVRTIGVVGAGTMGRGIAELAARSGYAVTLTDAMPGAADKAIAAVGEALARDVEKGRVTRAEADAVLARLTPGGLDAVAGADCIIEAVREDLDVKRALLGDLSRRTTTALIATNTSSLSVSAIAETITRPERFAGMHFFNPPTRMRVVEIVRGARTDGDTMAALAAVAETMGQRAFLVGDTPGFLVNHIGRALVVESLRLLDEGIAPAAELDRIARDALHFRMGPFELLDLVGLDVSAEVTEQIWRGFGEAPRFRPAPIARQRVAAGLLGRKLGAGFYAYEEGRMIAVPEDIAPAAPVAVRLVDVPAEVAALFPPVMVSEDAPVAVVAPVGNSVARTAKAAGLDPAATAGIDPVFTDRVTVAGPAHLAERVAATLRAAGRAATVVGDGPGMPAQRMAAMMVLVAADAAGRGIGSPEDIDGAARLALAYPQGPLELGDRVGPARIAAIADGLMRLTGDPRWRPSAWLDRRIAAGQSLAKSLPSPAPEPN